jgi:predicted nucleic acid-binding protein
MADGAPELVPILREAFEMAVPVIVLGEFRFGIRQARGRTRYERWLSELISNCRVLDVDAGTAERYAEIRDELKSQGRPIPANDLWIASLARQHSLPLVSRDQHFDSVRELKRISW